MLSVTHGSSLDVVPEEARRLADRLAAVHGDVHLANEASGWHLYMASPLLIAQGQRNEVHKRHLAVNAARYFGWGDKYEKLSPRSRDKSGLCMKSKTPYRVSDLLNMPPLSVRLEGMKDAGKVIDTKARKHLIDDGRGNMIPDHPGVVIPLSQLPADHPANFYMAQRGLTARIPDMERMFGLAWCEEEAPVDREIGRFYRKLHNGWRDTPQGRIIFHAYIRGVRQLWQGRYLEHSDEKTHWMWHPYHKEWFIDAHRESPDHSWVKLPPFDEPFENGNGDLVKWDPSKYINAMSSSRQQHGLLGYDAAVSFRQDRMQRFAILTEGPVDAGSFGPPAIGGAGSFLSEAAARLIACEFPAVILAYDTDAAGVNGREVARRMLSQEGLRCLDIYPEPGKDFGAMTHGACWSRVIPLLKHFQ